MLITHSLSTALRTFCSPRTSEASSCLPPRLLPDGVMLSEGLSLPTSQDASCDLTKLPHLHNNLIITHYQVVQFVRQTVIAAIFFFSAFELLVHIYRGSFPIWFWFNGPDVSRTDAFFSVQGVLGQRWFFSEARRGQASMLIWLDFTSDKNIWWADINQELLRSRLLGITC